MSDIAIAALGGGLIGCSLGVAATVLLLAWLQSDTTIRPPRRAPARGGDSTMTLLLHTQTTIGED